MVTNTDLAQAGRTVQEGIEERLLMLKGDEFLDPTGDWLLDLCVVNFGVDFSTPYQTLSALRNSLEAHRGEFGYVRWQQHSSVEGVFVIPGSGDVLKPGKVSWDTIVGETYINETAGAELIVNASHDMIVRDNDRPMGEYHEDLGRAVHLTRSDLLNLTPTEEDTFKTVEQRTYLLLPGAARRNVALVLGTENVVGLRENSFLLRDYQSGMEPLEYIQSQKRD
jgi:hypothetical protein